MGETSERTIQSLIDIIDRLRGPDGCMWDRQQTVRTVSRYLIDEAYEVIDAIEAGTADDVREELGDLLFQILFIINISRDNGRFDLVDVIEGISEKMIRRHPHVFGDTTVSSVEEIKTNWETIKCQCEGKEHSKGSLLSGIPTSLPSLTLAQKITEKASRVGFDWKGVDDVVDKVYEELDELKTAITDDRPEQISEEIGDILFSLVNLSRFVDVDPETALRSTVNKFKRRFSFIESKLADRGKDLRSSTLEEMDDLWNHYKKKENPGS
ncbi:MAG: nucleoside triphosphate pyrophosphohydrolase [Deltaproteobacteria bacterium]|nr:nucleoside triphosphate pyrophosphohydrolase [Deltaproteobacteria bacterium]MBN2688834.1 nucleoside triphosphate pyrophosphohydrolase [Deltaproteobacteria bacterium]